MGIRKRNPATNTLIEDMNRHGKVWLWVVGLSWTAVAVEEKHSRRKRAARTHDKKKERHGAKKKKGGGLGF